MTLKVRKTRENLKDEVDLRASGTGTPPPPPCLPLRPTPPAMQRSVSRRMLTRVREGITSRSRSTHSESTNLIRRLSGKRNPTFQISRESIDSMFEPAVQFSVPYVDLKVTKDRNFIDASQSADLMISVEATVRSRAAPMGLSLDSTSGEDALVDVSNCSTGDVFHGHPMGSITSLRLCYKPVQPCWVVEIAGQKSAKDLYVGQRCVLSLKVRVGKIETVPTDAADNLKPDDLFEALESMLGVLETEVLVVELKYRHSMLANDVVTVRETCRIRRPRTDNPWSMTDSQPILASPEAPALQVTDVDERVLPLRQGRSSLQLSPPKTTTAVTSATAPPVDVSLTDARDPARSLWRNLRGSSQLIGEELASIRQLERDDTLRSLREQALANKRSVGAETLRAWQFEEKKHGSETPWL